MAEPGRLFKPEEVAEILRVSRRTVIRWLKEGKLPGLRVGKLWRIREEDLEAFLKASAQKGGRHEQQLSYARF